ncbi:MAG TPA: glycosyltransferase family 39 protein [Blastocatellia bacterium]|nr:glycosyltransferase family 39 protein [Blastocatellia bacterium]
MDDVDSVTAQIARNMIESGDWVTARLNGVAYLEKPALRFWMVAVSYLIFGVHDWAARIPMALSAVVLCWLVRRIGDWAFITHRTWNSEAGTLAGVVLATCLGLFLFTRVLIPDVVLTLTTTMAMWSFLRALDEEEARPGLWSSLLAVSLGLGFLLKGLVAFVFPVGAGIVYLLLSGRFLARLTWRRLHPWRGLLIILLICLPWVALATWRNPPLFDLTMKSQAGSYHGFFWFFFLNEHLFRYLNLRYPRDYNTVPRVAFWLYHLIWLFPWSVWLPFVARLNFRPVDRAGTLRLFCLCWIGFTLVFFTFSTTQEYYSMPCYPALALLLGSVLYERGYRFNWAGRTVGAVALAGAIACGAVLHLTRDVVATGDIADALNYHASTLSLGKAGDLTLESLAWMRPALFLAIAAFLVGAFGAFWRAGRHVVTGLALMMLLFFGAAWLAMLRLDPYLSSRALAETLRGAPPGQLIVDDQYYAFSSVFFYAHRRALLLNGRVMNLEYGSYAPGAPRVFIQDRDLPPLWNGADRQYLVAAGSALPRLKAMLGDSRLYIVRSAGGKYLLTNQTLTGCPTLAELETGKHGPP